MHNLNRFIFALAVIILTCTPSLAQDNVKLPPAKAGSDPPDWLKAYPFSVTDFSFVRLKYEAVGHLRNTLWMSDYPDADANLSKRLQQITSLNVNLDSVVLSAENPRLTNHPFCYLSGNGLWSLNDSEIMALRAYLTDGGFLMIDDVWGEAEINHYKENVTRLFPDKQIEDLPLSHPLFHGVYEILEKPQVPSIHMALQGRQRGITWEREDSQEPLYLAVKDDTGRIMILMCLNTDLADGWERFEEDAWYREEFSEKRAFPMGINAIFYALTTSAK